MAKVKRGANGKFVSVDKDIAIFVSNFKNLRINMEPSVLNSKKGRTIKFLDGKYKTKDPEEIKFLKGVEAKPSAFVKINCIQEAVIEEEGEK